MTPRSNGEIGPARAEEIAELAEAIADQHCPTGKVAPEEIAARKDIRLIYDHYAEAFDGIIEHENGRFYIHCNLDRENLPDSPRGRFTLSHELGHYFIDEHRNALASGRVRPHPSFTDRATGNLRIEREADTFASHLLMPRSRFIAALPRARRGLGGIQDLAGKFNVSISCAAIRFVDAEVEPSVMIHLFPDGHMWPRRSQHFQSPGYAKILNVVNRLPSDSPTRICLAVGEKRSGVIGKKLDANVWFPALPKSRAQIREEAMTLGRYGVLILLTLPDSQ